MKSNQILEHYLKGLRIKRVKSEGNIQLLYLFKVKIDTVLWMNDTKYRDVHRHICKYKYLVNHWVLVIGMTNFISAKN